MRRGGVQLVSLLTLQTPPPPPQMGDARALSPASPPPPLVFCGPSGVGKGTLISRLMVCCPRWRERAAGG